MNAERARTNFLDAIGSSFFPKYELHFFLISEGL